MLSNTEHMSTRPKDARSRPRGRYDASRPPLRLRSVVHDCAAMDSAGINVRRYVRAERELRGWNQIDLAEEAGVGRGTIQRLEDGVRLSEGKESRIESAFGWAIGSLDVIRDGGEPVRLSESSRKPLAQWTRGEATARADEIARETGSEQAGDDFMAKWAQEKKAAQEKHQTNTKVSHDAT